MILTHSAHLTNSRQFSSTPPFGSFSPQRTKSQGWPSSQVHSPEILWWNFTHKLTIFCVTDWSLGICQILLCKMDLQGGGGGANQIHKLFLGANFGPHRLPYPFLPTCPYICPTVNNQGDQDLTPSEFESVPPMKEVSVNPAAPDQHLG